MLHSAPTSPRSAQAPLARSLCVPLSLLLHSDKYEAVKKVVEALHWSEIALDITDGSEEPPNELKTDILRRLSSLYASLGEHDKAIRSSEVALEVLIGV